MSLHDDEELPKFASPRSVRTRRGSVEPSGHNSATFSSCFALPPDSTPLHMRAQMLVANKIEFLQMT